MAHAKTLVLILALAFAGAAAHASSPAGGGTIKKCKDDQGRWHYGDNAAAECAKSKIVEITDTGQKKQVIAAPPTAEELADRERRKDEIAREEAAKKEAERRDQLLLSTYGHEDDIIFVRDRKISQIEAGIKAAEQTLAPVRAALERMQEQAKKEQEKEGKVSEQTQSSIDRAQAQITRHEAAIVAKRKEQQEMREQYAKELARFREIKSGVAKTDAAKPEEKK